MAGRKVTKAQATKVLSEVKRTFKPYIDPKVEGSGPTLVMDFDWFGYGGYPAIVWEGGPYEWSILASNGGVDEELTTLAMTMPEYVAFERTGKMANPVRVKPIVAPEGTYLEPITSWALGLFRIDA
ncbi:MAG: hypothetical protein ACOYB2_19725 [Limnohabitans sp.]